VRRQAGCLISAAAVLASTVLPWSSTTAAGRSGWETASLALALDEAVHEPVLTVLACLWFVVPLAAATALCVSVLLPRRLAGSALRVLGALLTLVVLTTVVALQRTGLDVVPLGPFLALLGALALMALPPRTRTRSRSRRNGAAATGVQR
jgi:hypothetical protein